MASTCQVHFQQFFDFIHFNERQIDSANRNKMRFIFKRDTLTPHVLFFSNGISVWHFSQLSLMYSTRSRVFARSCARRDLADNVHISCIAKSSKRLAFTMFSLSLSPCSLAIQSKLNFCFLAQPNHSRLRPKRNFVQMRYDLNCFIAITN